MNTYQKNLVAQLQALVVHDPPAPWRYIDTVHVGGLYEVGYGSTSDLLLVVSASGRSVINCLVGAKVARDRTEITEDWYDPIQLVAEGIGPLANQHIRLAGIHGGGLPSHSPDYWSLEFAAPNWPNGFVILVAPLEFINGQRQPDVKVKVAPRFSDDVLVAYGFSPTGQSFVVATGDALEIFART